MHTHTQRNSSIVKPELTLQKDAVSLCTLFLQRSLPMPWAHKPAARLHKKAKTEWLTTSPLISLCSEQPWERMAGQGSLGHSTCKCHHGQAAVLQLGCAHLLLTFLIAGEEAGEAVVTSNLQ